MCAVRFCLVTLLAFFSMGFSMKSDTTTALSDAEAAGKLVGTWSGINKGVGIRTCSEKTYNPDGTTSGYISDQILTGNDYREVGRITCHGRWKIEAGTLIIYDMRSNPEVAITPESVIRDRVIFIGQGYAVFENPDTGKRFKRKRIQPES